MFQAQHETFREELAIKYPAFGYPLWEPGSRGRYHAVQVGDVGFIREGYFHQLFNVLHPTSASGDSPSDPSCRVLGSNELLQIRMDNHIGRSTEGYKEFLSKSIRVVSRGRQVDALRPEDDAQVTFSCSGKRGALLSLPFPAQREDTAALRDFGNFMVKNIDSWFAYAEDLGLGIDRMEDIILVTGCHRARSWVIATFSEGQADAQVSFGAEVFGDSGVGLEWRDARGGDLKLGPSGRNLPEDQCLFVRGFRVVRFLKFWPRLRAQATLFPDIDGHGPDPGTGLRLPLTTIAEDIKHEDPLHVLLQYIAERAPDSDMALVHDDDLAFIDGAMLETLEPDELIGYLRSATPEVQQIRYEESGTVREVKVATLSTQNALRAATPAQPLKGILKTGSSESSVVFRPSLIQQDRDGYASSPEKGTSLRPSQIPSRAPSGRLSKSKPPQIASTASADPSKPPATLHWKLLPFDAQRSKGKLKFDFARSVDEITLAEGQRGSRPLSTLERNKSAAEPGLTEMIIQCLELPDWPVYVARQSGLRCVDVFEAIRDTYNVVLTSTERSNHLARVRDIERRRPPTPEGVTKVVRRRDLLEGKTLFLGLDWRTSGSGYPYGWWFLRVGTPSCEFDSDGKEYEPKGDR